MRHAVRLAHAQHGAFFVLADSLSVFRKIGVLQNNRLRLSRKTAILLNRVVWLCSPRCVPGAHTARLARYNFAVAQELHTK